MVLYLVAAVLICPFTQAASSDGVLRAKLPRGLQIFFASSRLNEGSRSEASFGGSRHLDLGSGMLEYGTAALKTPPGLILPASCKTGIEYREALKAGTLLWQNAKVNFIGCFEEEDLLAKVGKCHGKICVYIPGYDKSFDEALQDASMLFADYRQYTKNDEEFLPILFSWPSAGNRSKYSVDEANLDWSKASFDQFMDRLIKAKPDDASLDLVCHSMGARLALNYLNHEHGQISYPVLNNLFLCSADYDFHEAESIRESLERTVSGLIYIFVSDRDRPLIMSQYLHGEPRLGRPFDPPGKSSNPQEDISQNISDRIKSSEFWAQLTSNAAELLLGPALSDTADVTAWLKQNPALDREFGEKSRLIDVSDLSETNMGHGMVWSLVSSLMAGKAEFPQLKGTVVHKRPDKTYLAQCGGRPRVLYRYLRFSAY